jgi:MoaA/NifB/PqqE/SkfB family radical SAM enzyme
MERVDIKVGFYCNNHCAFCVQGRKREFLPAKSKKEIEKSLKEAYDKGKHEVVFTGGEPTLHPNFLELVKIAKEIGFQEIQIQSNGRMFAYPDFCQKTIMAGATLFSPALHGADPEMHDFLTEIPGSFSQTSQGIRNLKALGQYVMTNSVITKKNYKQIPELAQLLVNLGVDQFQFAFVHILGSAQENKRWLVPRKSEIAPYVKRGLDIGIRAGKKVTTEAIPYCFLEGYEEYVAERIIPKTRIYDANFVVEEYGDYRRDCGKIRSNKCNECKYVKVCEGPWKEYPELFGWDEFDPVKK